jgi:hypothetical protein
MPSTSGAAAAAQSDESTQPGASTSVFGQEDYGREQHPGVHSLHDAEPAVSGWGGDEYEDGMGML